MSDIEGAIGAMPPFVEDDEGYATEQTVRKALDDCEIGFLADTPALYRIKDEQGEVVRLLRGALAPLIAENCLAVHLRRRYPSAFVAISMAAVQDALDDEGEDT